MWIWRLPHRQPSLFPLLSSSLSLSLSSRSSLSRSLSMSLTCTLVFSVTRRLHTALCLPLTLSLVSLYCACILPFIRLKVPMTYHSPFSLDSTICLSPSFSLAPWNVQVTDIVRDGKKTVFSFLHQTFFPFHHEPIESITSDSLNHLSSQGEQWKSLLLTRNLLSLPLPLSGREQMKLKRSQ